MPNNKKDDATRNPFVALNPQNFASFVNVYHMNRSTSV